MTSCIVAFLCGVGVGTIACLVGAGLVRCWEWWTDHKPIAPTVIKVTTAREWEVKTCAGCGGKMYAAEMALGYHDNCN